jgi:hypothetical protein
MPLPNLNSPTKVEGRNVLVTSIPTSASGCLVNPSGSNETFRISNIYVSNIDGVNACDVNCYILDNSTSPAATGYLAFTVSIPADASLVLLTKNENTYLMENQTLFLGASADNDLSAVINYEDIS